jgi:hypothetical protein
MTWDFPNPSGTPTTWLQNLVASLRGVINSFPGDQIQSGTVPRNRLQKQGAEACLNIHLGDLAGTSNAKIAKVGAPVMDGGAVTRRVTYVSVGCNNLATFTKVAGCQILLATGATYAARVTQLTIDLNDAGWTATGDEPLLVAAGFNWVSGVNLYVSYVAAGAPVYNGTHHAVYYEAPHADPTT